MGNYILNVRQIDLTPEDIEETRTAMAAFRALGQDITNNDEKSPAAGEGDDASESEEGEYDCQLCFCNYTEDEITYLPCGHFLCTRCMTNLITHAIDNGQCASMTCVHSEDDVRCTQAIIREVVEAVAPEKLQKYSDRVEELRLKALGAIYCPNPDGCTNRAGKQSQVVPESGTKHQRCPECKYHFCSNLKCKIMDPSLVDNDMNITVFSPWHAGRSCAEYQAAVVTAAALGGGESKPCPGVLANGRRCPEVIQKNDGCNHMTCATCKHEFCWTCLHPHTSPHRGNYNAHRPPPANKEGECNGCGCAFCGTNQVYAWGHRFDRGDVFRIEDRTHSVQALITSAPARHRAWQEREAQRYPSPAVLV